MLLPSQFQSLPQPANGRVALAVVFALASMALWLDPVIPQLFGSGKGHDYPQWFATGERLLHDGPVYIVEPNGQSDFLYTPLAALLLAIPSYFGRSASVVILASVILATWWIAIWLARRLVDDGKPVSPWIASLPVAVTVPFVFDQFHNGQPNLFLLALMLGGFCLLSAQREWLAGLPFATAAAIKVFPVLIFPYLLWRRYWRTAASMAAFMIVLLVLVPGSIRGFQRNFDELSFWVHSMLLSTNDTEFAQRVKHWGWKNQSLYAVEHRLLSPINAELEAVPPVRPVYVNLLNLNRHQADLVFVVTELAVGLGFMALLPARRRRTPRSDAAEWSIVLLLIVLASLVAYSYYFVWLLLPYTVLVQRAATEPDRKVARRTAIMIGVSLLLLAIGIDGIEPRYSQAAGNFLWAAAVVIAALAVEMRRSARAA